MATNISKGAKVLFAENQAFKDRVIARKGATPELLFGTPNSSPAIRGPPSEGVVASIGLPPPPSHRQLSTPHAAAVAPPISIVSKTSISWLQNCPAMLH